MYDIETGKKGYPTLRVNNSYLHSRYDPVLEGARLVEGLDIANKSCIVIFGMGLGYHVMPLLGLTIKIIVIDRSPSIIRCLEDVGYIDRFKGISLYAGDTVGIGSWFANEVNEEDSDSIVFFDHEPSIRLEFDYYNSVKGVISSILRSKIQSYITTLGFAKRWHENVIKNTIHLTRFLKLTKGIDAPVFIIGSGPSLDSHIGDLIKLKNKGILISLAPSYRRLIDIGIVPDFVISTDGGIANRMHILPEDVLNSESILVTSLSATPNLFNRWQKDIVIINHGLPIEDYILSGFIRLPMQGTVTSAAFLFARQLFSGDIFLFGIDFAFTDGLYHHKGGQLESKILFSSNKLMSFDKEYYKFIAGFMLSKVKGYDGNNILTSLNMLSYLRWFSRELVKGGDNVYVIGSRGARIDGVRSIRVEDIINYPDISKSKGLGSMVRSLSLGEFNRVRERVIRLHDSYNRIEGGSNYDYINSFIDSIGNRSIDRVFTFHNKRILKRFKRSGILSREGYNDLSYSIRRTLKLLKRSISSFTRV